MTASSSEANLRAVPLLSGVALVAIYIRIGDVIGYQAGYGPPLWPFKWDGPTPFTHVLPSEFRMWLAQLVLVVPAAFLIAWGLAPRLGPALVRLLDRIDHASPRAWKLAGLALFVALTVYAVIGRHFILLDESITDDENAVRFGARMIAEGHLSVPILQPAGAYTDLFTYQRDGMVSAMDFPGVLMFDAVAVKTGLGSLLYALASAAGGVAFAYAAGRWFGRRASVVAAAIWCLSPMISSLALTTHGQIASRTCVALALAFAARLDTDAGSPRRDAILLGLVAGVGFLCRPFEITCVLGPLGVWLAWRLRARAAWIAAGFAPSIVWFAIYNSLTTGIWYLQCRFAPGVTGADNSLRNGPWERLGFNVGWNLLMLAVFFLGIPAVAAVIAGIRRRPTISVVLALGIAMNLVLSLLHDNTGIHSVGPIHLSEASVLVGLLATAGIVRGASWLAAARVPRTMITTGLAAYFVIACGMFDISNLASLHVAASSRTTPARMLEALDIHHAVVVTEPYVYLPQVDPKFAPWGTWELQYPHPDPFFRDDIIYVQPLVPLAALRARFPDRAFYSMTYKAESGQSSIHIKPIAP